LSIRDIQNNFLYKYKKRVEQHIYLLKDYYHYDYKAELRNYGTSWFQGIEMIKKFTFIDSEHFINKQLELGKSIIAEGAQGTLLDIDFGSYPFVTSSSTITAGACTGLGIAPQKIGKVFGIFKAYCTRVGSGPFPTELNDSIGEKMREAGREYGSTTGRPRRCGWLDLVALKYAIMIDGASELIMMKADVLDEFDTIKICTGYKINGIVTDEFPHELDDKVEPVYEELQGWKTNLTRITKKEEFPEELSNYMRFIESNVGVPITIISVGPNRSQTIKLA